MTLSSRSLLLACLCMTACSGSVQPSEPTEDSPKDEPSAKDPTPTDDGASDDDTPAPVPVTPNPVGGTAGLLGCPTVAAAGDTIAVAKTDLSKPFQTACAACHGADGAGQPGYPALRGATSKLDLATYKRVVREGKGDMPGFSAAFISDAQMEADFRALSAGVDVGQAQHPSRAWTAGQVDARRRDGLAVWRKRDAHGASCSGCHSPDAVDLAVIGFPDAAILRRALQHLGPDDALALVDFIYAQRRHFGIDQPCDPSWRPFQPGGRVLEGDTKWKQDLSFAQALAGRGLLVATDRIDSLDKARKARDQFLAIKLRELPIGVPLPHWSRDHFNGPTDRSIDDWMPEVPRMPKAGQESAYVAVVDRYLADPTDANLFALLDADGSMTDDAGALAGAPGGNDTLDHEGRLRAVMRNKRTALLIGQHFFRMEVLGRKGERWLDRGPVAFPTQEALNPFFAFAQESFGPPCGGESSCPTWVPEGIRAELDAPAGQKLPDYGEIRHHWYSLGQLFDNALIHSYGFGHNTTEAVYWQGLFTAHAVHQTIFNGHRTLLQTVAPMGGTEGLVGAMYTDRKGGPPLLDGEWMRLSTVAPDRGGSDEHSYFIQHVNTNTQRMLLYLMKERLQAGGSVVHPDALVSVIGDWKSGTTYNVTQEYIQRVTKLKANAAFYNDFALHDEVTALVRKAPVVSP